jgi:hypothetical protein
MKQVAAILGISYHTVAFHKYTMMERLGIDTNAELIQYAMRKYMAPTHGSWTVTDSSSTRLAGIREGTNGLPGFPQRDIHPQRQVGGAERRRPENRYATDIQ